MLFILGGALLPVVDMWLPDYKAEDDQLHQRCTGVLNKVIKKNLERLIKAKAKREVRMLVVPNLTDGADAQCVKSFLLRKRFEDGLKFRRSSKGQVMQNEKSKQNQNGRKRSGTDRK